MMSAGRAHGTRATRRHRVRPQTVAVELGSTIGSVGSGLGTCADARGRRDHCRRLQQSVESRSAGPGAIRPSSRPTLARAHPIRRGLGVGELRSTNGWHATRSWAAESDSLTAAYMAEDVRGRARRERDPGSAMTRRRPTLELQRASLQLGTLASPHRFRVVADPEGFPIIPGRYGQIEWYCDGVQCWSCALPGQFALAVHTNRRRLFERLWAIPAVNPHQTGA